MVRWHKRTVMWTPHQMNRMSQGKGRGNRVKMVEKENERKTLKKKPKRQWGNGAIAEGKGRKENAYRLTFSQRGHFHHSPKATH